MLKERAPLSARQVTSMFNRLATEHAQKLVEASAAAAWRRIEVREGARAQRAAQGRSAIGWWVVLPAAAVAAVIALLVWGSSFELEYELQGATAQNGLISTRAQPALLSFSDNSRIEVAQETTLHVDVVAKHSALARLSAGKLNVSVSHDEDTDWRFFAGPYEVRVIGTKFDLGWQPSGERLSIAMREGRVRVIGPDLDRSLGAGEKLDLGQAPEQVATLETPRAGEPVRPERAAEPAPVAIKAERAPEDAAAKSGDWASLVAKGKFSAVIAAAETAGIEYALARSGGADLKALAQAARYTGRSALAVRALQALRQRFAAHSGGRQAAFFLGRIYDQQGRSADALRWLNTYLSEAPGDVYASEALGRKLTLVRRVEGDAAAERVARQYLERFPAGAYARTARARLAE